LPASHNYYLQSYIYASISRTLAAELHDGGWDYGKRHFKMFTFSSMTADHAERVAIVSERDPDQRPRPFLRLSSPCWFFLSSPENRILQELAQGLLSDRDARIGNSLLQLESVAILPPPVFPDGPEAAVGIHTLSPITVYKTDETRHTTYFSPHDAAFAPYVRENARRKFTAYVGHEPDLTGFDIMPLEERDHPATINFKGTMICGYTGRFQLSGQGDLLHFLYDAGVGSKNSEGCGMIELQ
jgi:CRISPR-associated endoribonuclease Cas6